MERQLKNYIRTESSTLSLRELLQASPIVLLSVSAEAEQQLQTLEIFSVFDLAMSRVFDAARRLTGASDGPSDLLQFGSVPADLVDIAAIVGKPLDQVQFEPIQVLDGIGSHNGPALESALHLKTIRDLALWPPYQNARTILTAVFDPEALPGVDPEAPADLIPRSGEYPTDRSLYQTFVLIDAPGSDTTDLEKAGPILLTTPTQGFSQPAIGASLTYAQEWFSQGVALGQLLHSVALAPGESTRLAVIDYERRTSGSVTEAVDQTERLSNSILQNRAVSEITDAVATESQEGFSRTKSNSRSSLSGAAVGGGGPLILGGGASGSSGNRTRATTVSTSEGRREVSTHLQQNIQNSTQQNAASARSRRAATITETSLQESETISTRTVTNYNHMHALSVQYYEVVQLYRTELRLQRAEGCLFIPMQVFDFSDETVVFRFREILIAAALNDVARELLASADGNVVVSPAFTPAMTILGGSDELQDPQEARDRARRRAIASAKRQSLFKLAQFNGALTGFRGNDRPFQMSASVSLANIGWSDPAERLQNIVLVSDDDSEVTVTNNGTGLPTGGVNPDLGAPVLLSQLREIRLEYLQDDNEPYALPITLTFRLSGNRTAALPFDCVLLQGRSRSTLLRIQTPSTVGSVVPHLQENALYYSQQIWLNADSHLIVMLLASFQFRGKSVIDYIDPVPVTVLGNMLGFVWHDEDDEEFAAWKKEHVNLAKVDFDLVSVPTGGIFAEAVLGRFNSAEKLDLTRFWNWQDSPIPILPPEISAIQAGQHQPADVPQTGRLDQPIVNIVNPPTLPDPSTVAGTLSALGNGALFRDMSGLIQTIALAQAGLQAASQDALGGASLAGTNLANVAALQGKALDAVIAVAGVLSGVPGIGALGRAPGGANVSTAGGAVNLGKELDAIPPGTGGGSTGQAPNPPPFDLGGGGTGGSGGGGASPGNSSGPTTVPDGSGTIFASTAGNRTGAAFDALIGRTPTGVNAALFGGGPGSATSGPGTDAPVVLERETAYIIHDFDVDQATLKPVHTAKLDDLIAFLEEHPDAQIVTITGRASQTGPERNNERLSFNRAETTRAYLVASGILPSRIGPTIGRGSRLPIVDATGSEEAMNRSVEIICDWKLELEQVPSISSSRMSTRWNIDLGATFGFGAASFVGQVQIGRLTKKTSGESRTVEAFLLGPELGKSLGPVFAASVTVPGFEEGNFETPGPVDFDYFDGQLIALFPVGGTFAVGGSATKIVFPRGRSDDATTLFASIDIGFTFGLGGAALLGILNVNDE